MNPVLKKAIYPFLLPNGLLCLLLLFGLGRTDFPAEFLPFLKVFPYAVVGIGLLLGWRFNRTRLIYAILLLLLVDVSLEYLAPVDNGRLIFQAATILLPLNLLLISWFRERGLLNIWTIFWIVLLLAELFGCGWLIREYPSQSQLYLDYQLIDVPALLSIQLSQPLLLLSLLVLLLFAGRCFFTVAAFEVSFFWAQMILLVGFSGLGAQPFRLYLASAGLILIMGIMETSHSLAYRDELTGLPGRRALNEALAKLGSRYTLAMLDIDYFKKFNDTHGHDVGDQVLKMVASKLATVSGGGKVFRYGGEEFSIIFSRKSSKESLPFLETVRVAVEDARFIPRGKDRPKKKPKKKPVGRKNQTVPLKVTISIGAADRGGDLQTADAVINAADRALYRAKKAGRNRTLC